MRVKLRKGDTVELISGPIEDKGKRGEVIRVIPDGQKVVVQGLNVRTKHQRQVQQQGRNINPGKVHFEAPIFIANVMMVCPKCNKTARIAIHREDGKIIRVCKNCDAQIDS